jgi:hypothetical protein
LSTRHYSAAASTNGASEEGKEEWKDAEKEEQNGAADDKASAESELLSKLKAKEAEVRDLTVSLDANAGLHSSR